MLLRWGSFSFCRTERCRLFWCEYNWSNSRGLGVVGNFFSSKMWFNYYGYTSIASKPGRYSVKCIGEDIGVSRLTRFWETLITLMWLSHISWTLPELLWICLDISWIFWLHLPLCVSVALLPYCLKLLPVNVSVCSSLQTLVLFIMALRIRSSGLT